MEQILPGTDPEDFDSDPILEANELKDRGQIARAKKLLGCSERALGADDPLAQQREPVGEGIGVGLGCVPIK